MNEGVSNQTYEYVVTVPSCETLGGVSSCFWPRIVFPLFFTMSLLKLTNEFMMSHAGEIKDCVTHMNESCHKNDWVRSHIWMSCVTHLKRSRHTNKCASSHVWRSHVTEINASRYTHECVTSHTWMHVGTRIKLTRHTYECDTSRTWMYRATLHL